MSSSIIVQPPTEIKKPSSSNTVKCFLLSSLNRFCLLFGLCTHVTLVLLFRVRCKCAVCTSLPGLMSDQQVVRPSAPVTPSNDLVLQRHRPPPPTSLKLNLFSSMTSQRRMVSSSSLQSSKSQPSVSEPNIPPQTSTQCSVRSPSSVLRRMQSSTGAQHNMRTLINTERGIQSSRKAELSMQPSSAPRSLASPTRAQCNPQSVLADVAVMFQPPYAVQDVVDADLKCAMLTIIDRMCGHDLFHRRCVALRHYREEQPAVEITPTELVTRPIWGPQLSGSQHTYPWVLPDGASELDEQLDSRMRNLWSAPPAFGQPAEGMLNVEAGSKVGGGSLPALSTFMCWRTHKIQSAVRQIIQESAKSNSTSETVDSGVSYDDCPASVQLNASAQQTSSGNYQSQAEEAEPSQELTPQTELKPHNVTQLSSTSFDGTLPVVSESTPTLPLPAPDIAQSPQLEVALEDAQSVVASEDTQSVVASEDAQSVVASEDAQSVLASENALSLLMPVDMQSKLCILQNQNKLTVLQERQEMQQRQVQAMREKRALKKKKRQKEKKRKQQQLQHLHQSLCDHEDKAQLHQPSDDLEQREHEATAF